MLYSFALNSGVPATSLVGPVVSTGLSPEGIAVDPTGKLIAVENAGEGGIASTISLFTVGSGGVLAPQKSVPAGINPLFVTFCNSP
jgi:DNA-binding beta-propeller fold protein YncE